MKLPILLATTCALFALLGCEPKAVTAAAVGPFEVNGETGTATGQAFGIRFNAAGATGADVTSDLSGSPEFPSRAEIALADDLKITLTTKAPGEGVAFALNGKSFGNLKTGDQVEIETNRNVRVNGETRTSGDRPSE